MAEATQIPAPSVWRPLRLATLVRLRWLAIAGQSASVLFVAFTLGFPVPLAQCFALIGLSVVVNLVLSFRSESGHHLSNNFAALQLVYDSLQLGGLLWLTGGLGNPFSLLLLVPVSVSATTLTQRATIVISVLITLISSILVISHIPVAAPFVVPHLPLPWDPATPLVLDVRYIIGQWVSLLLGVAFIAAYTIRVAHEARQMADALAATELILLRQQQLSALDGLAAAAAHELGTPLSTIALAAKEMRDEMPAGHLAEDTDLIIEQAARCRAILGKLRNLDAKNGDPFSHVGLSELVAEVSRPYERLGKDIVVSRGDQTGLEPVLPRNEGLLYGLGNLIENAASFASQRVEIVLSWDQQGFDITITDDGPGFPSEMIARLGEPYLTSRAHELIDDPTVHGGLGLGIFIAKTLLERTGAKLGFLNTKTEGHAKVMVHWPHGIILPS